MRAFLRIVLFLLVGPMVGLLAVSLGIGTWTLLTQGRQRGFTNGWDLHAAGKIDNVLSVGGFLVLL